MPGIKLHSTMQKLVPSHIGIGHLGWEKKLDKKKEHIQFSNRANVPGTGQRKGVWQMG